MMNNQESEQPEHLEQIRDIIFGPQKREMDSRFMQIDAQLTDLKTQFVLMVESLNATFKSELQGMRESFENALKTAEERRVADRVEGNKQMQQISSALDASVRSTATLLSERAASIEAQLGDVRHALANTESRFDLSLQKTIEVAKKNIAALGEQVKLLEQSKNADRDDLTRQLENMQGRFDKSLQHAVQSAAEKITALTMTMRNEHARLEKDLDERAATLTDSKVSREVMAEALIELGMKVKAGERLSELKLLTKKPGS